MTRPAAMSAVTASPSGSCSNLGAAQSFDPGVYDGSCPSTSVGCAAAIIPESEDKRTRRSRVQNDTTDPHRALKRVAFIRPSRLIPTALARGWLNEWKIYARRCWPMLGAQAVVRAGRRRDFDVDFVALGFDDSRSPFKRSAETINWAAHDHERCRNGGQPACVSGRIGSRKGSETYIALPICYLDQFSR
jgi:hypothetical protein